MLLWRNCSFSTHKTPKKRFVFTSIHPVVKSILGLAMYDAMQQVNAPVSTVAVGMTASFGTVMLAGGEAGRRYALKNATIHMHQPHGGAQGQASDIAIQAEESLRLRAKLEEILAHHTGQTTERIHNDLDRDIYLSAEQPVDSADLTPLTLPVTNIEKWLSIDAANTITINADAARKWLTARAANYSRPTTDARFYFDDLTQELVVIEPHVAGRELDVETTLQRLLLGVESAERSIPLTFTAIVPEINANVKGIDLGITELLAEETTWFYDSSEERKHNIRIGAAKFHGLVVRPGEEFSFNKYLGPNFRKHRLCRWSHHHRRQNTERHWRRHLSG